MKLNLMSSLTECVTFHSLELIGELKPFPTIINVRATKSTRTCISNATGRETHFQMNF